MNALVSHNMKAINTYCNKLKRINNLDQWIRMSEFCSVTMSVFTFHCSPFKSFTVFVIGFYNIHLIHQILSLRNVEFSIRKRRDVIEAFWTLYQVKDDIFFNVINSFQTNSRIDWNTGSLTITTSLVPKWVTAWECQGL